MNKTELNAALNRYRILGNDTGRDSVQPYDVHNILVLGVEKYIEFIRKIKNDHSDFSGMDLSRLECCDMFFDRDEKFANTVLIGADMRRCDFIENDMRGVDFSYAYLMGSCFNRCNLSSACFEGACLEGVEFVECNMRGCNITKDCGAKFIGCYGLPWFTL